MYHPPPSQSNPISNAAFLEEFDNYLESVVLSDELLCIAGDFNIHMNKSEDPYQIRLSELLVSYGLVNHVHVPTHKHGNTLDLLITRDNDELNFSEPTTGYMISDHYFVHSNLGFPRPNLTFKSITFRKIKDIDITAFRRDLSVICDELLQINDINVLATQYNKLLGKCLDKHASPQEKTMISRPKTSWYTDSLKEMKRERRRLERKYRQTNSDINFNNFKHAKNTYVSALNQAHCDHYESEIIGAKGNQRKLFSIIQELAAVNKDNPLPDYTCIKELADQFGDFLLAKLRISDLTLNFKNAHFKSMTTKVYPPLPFHLLNFSMRRRSES